eukprot:TRINITY_DN1792_c0_g3_i1.p1 TRINITY_DN1792_c0_g3~~TRINITY_DN1792_c0_g3_i1.p1  ORF type:complete len:215 (-),score=49.31 TRINITY_DN1792_c0_g3_i1:121-765(-)
MLSLALIAINAFFATGVSAAADAEVGTPSAVRPCACGTPGCDQSCSHLMEGSSSAEDEHGNHWPREHNVSWCCPAGHACFTNSTAFNSHVPSREDIKPLCCPAPRCCASASLCLHCLASDQFCCDSCNGDQDDMFPCTKGKHCCGGCQRLCVDNPRQCPYMDPSRVRVIVLVVLGCVAGLCVVCILGCASYSAVRLWRGRRQPGPAVVLLDDAE